MKALIGLGLVSLVAVVLTAGFRISELRAAGAAAESGQEMAAQGQQIVSCGSDDMRRNYCPADVRAGAQLVRQQSDSPCIFNRTWGFINGRGIWVDRGCRADFSVGAAGWGGWDRGYNVYCASDDGKRNVCPTDTRGGVRLDRQRSGSPCDFGRTWATPHAASGWIAAAAPISRSAEAMVEEAVNGNPAGAGYRW